MDHGISASMRWLNQIQKAFFSATIHAAEAKELCACVSNG